MWAALLVTSVSAQAPAETGSLRGRVRDQDDLPIPGVLITLRSDSLQEERQHQTDVEGRFAFPALPPGTYDLTAERRGFDTVERHSISIAAAGAVIINPEMKWDNHDDDDGCILYIWPPAIEIDSVSVRQPFEAWTTRYLPTGRAYPANEPMAPGVLYREGPPDRLRWGSEHTYLLDRVDITDPETGGPVLTLSPEALGYRDRVDITADTEIGHGLGGVTRLFVEGGSDTRRPDWSHDTRAHSGAWTGHEAAPIVRSASAVSGRLARDRAWAHAAQSTTVAGGSTAHLLSGTVTAALPGLHQLRASAQAAHNGTVAISEWGWFNKPSGYLLTTAALVESGSWRRGQIGTTASDLAILTESDHTISAGLLHRWEADTGDAQVHHTSAFVQDTYTPHNNVTIQAGVRYDAAQYPALADTPLDGVRTWSPRLGVSWDPYSNNRMAVKAMRWRSHSLDGMQLTPAQAQALPAEDGPLAPRTDGMALGVEHELPLEIAARAYYTRLVATNRYVLHGARVEREGWIDDRLDVYLSRYWLYDSWGILGRYTHATRDDIVEQHEASLGVAARLRWAYRWTPQLGVFGAVRDGGGGLNVRYWQQIPARRGTVNAMVQLDDVVRYATGGAPAPRRLTVGLRYER